MIAVRRRERNNIVVSRARERERASVSGQLRGASYIGRPAERRRRDEGEVEVRERRRF